MELKLLFSKPGLLNFIGWHNFAILDDGELSIAIWVLNKLFYLKANLTLCCWAVIRDALFFDRGLRWGHHLSLPEGKRHHFHGWKPWCMRGLWLEVECRPHRVKRALSGRCKWVLTDTHVQLRRYSSLSLELSKSTRAHVDWSFWFYIFLYPVAIEVVALSKHFYRS